MKNHLEEILRWVTIVICGGCGVWQLFEGRYGFVGWHQDWLSSFFEFSLHVLIAGPLLAVVYFCLRREYRKLFLVLGAVGAILLFGAFMKLPEQLGMDRYFESNLNSVEKVNVRRGFSFMTGPYYLLVMFVPIIVAAWFYRLCRYLAYHKPHSEKNDVIFTLKTHGTRWLLWLGVLCMMLPSIGGMLLMFNQITASYSPEQTVHWIYWTIGLGNIGILLLFLGLVRRRPKPASPHA